MPECPEALVSIGKVQQFEGTDAHLLIIGEEGGSPPRRLPPGAGFFEANTFRAPSTRDVAGPHALERLFAHRGIGANTRLILADANGGPHAALAFWTLARYGHARLHLLDGGLPLWESSEHSFFRKGSSETTGYRLGAPDLTARALRDDVRRHLHAGHALLDVRSPAEFRGVLVAPPNAPQEGILRGGHLPGAQNIPWTSALRPDGTFQPLDDLTARYRHAPPLSPEVPIIVYSRTAARACHTWFVLTHLLDFREVRVYDGGWAEWGNLVGAPIERGERGERGV